MTFKKEREGPSRSALMLFGTRIYKAVPIFSFDLKKEQKLFRSMKQFLEIPFIKEHSNKEDFLKFSRQGRTLIAEFKLSPWVIVGVFGHVWEPLNKLPRFKDPRNKRLRIRKLL